MSDGVRCPSPVVYSASPLARLEAAMARDIEADRTRAATASTEESLSFSDFLHTTEEVPVPQRVAELRAMRGALASTMLSSDIDVCQ